MIRPRLAALAALLVGLALAGCSTRRTLTIDSDPRGATVWVNGVHRGVTPVVVPFTHPGTWSVRVEKPGYAGLAQDVGVASTLADAPVLDLAAEILVREKRWTWTARLAPLPPHPGPGELEQALERARAFRGATHRAVEEPGTPRRSAR